MPVKFFKTAQDFRKWLEKYHDKETELLVGYYKVGSGKPSMTWSESVDQALCFGWIDGVRRSIDEESYCNRFTPRRPSSNWSSINIKKVEVLIAQGLMRPAGLKIFEQRKEAKSGIYSFESSPKTLSVALEKDFKKHAAAWKFFCSQAPSYQKTMIHWVMSAKQETTQVQRLSKIIDASEKQKRHS